MNVEELSRFSDSEFALMTSDFSMSTGILEFIILTWVILYGYVEISQYGNLLY